ncbi:unnamed protein product [Leuciscus chuanchicus]
MQACYVGHLYVTPVGVKSRSHGNQQPSAAAPLEKLDYPKEAEDSALYGDYVACGAIHWTGLAEKSEPTLPPT